MSDSERLDSNNFNKKLKLNVNTKKLITLVRGQPCIWDRSSIEYKNRVLKDRAWHDIICQFEPNYQSFCLKEKYLVGNFIIKKWCNIRDSYVKSKKPVRVEKRPYIYSPYLKFLDDTLNIDPSTGKRRTREQDIIISNEDEENESEGQATWMEVFVESDNAIIQPEVPSKKIYPENEYPSWTNERETIANFLENLIRKKEDEDYAFFASITPELKKLSENSKLEFKILVLKLLKNLKKRDREKETMVTVKTLRVDSDSE